MEKRIVVAIFLEIVKRVIIIQLLDDSIVWETITNKLQDGIDEIRNCQGKLTFQNIYGNTRRRIKGKISLKSIFTRTNGNVHCPVR